jgi:hypothetical protein
MTITRESMSETLRANTEALHYLFEAIAHSHRTLLDASAAQDMQKAILRADKLFTSASIFFSLSKHEPDTMEQLLQRFSTQWTPAGGLSAISAIASMGCADAEQLKAELEEVFTHVKWDAVPAAISKGKHYDPFIRLTQDAYKAGIALDELTPGEKYRALAERALDSIVEANRLPHIQETKAALDAMVHAQQQGR